MRLPSTFPSARASRVVLASACLLVAGAAHGGVAARQHLAVTESNYRLDAPGLQGLHAGLVTVSVRNTAAGQHGVLILRLKHPTTGDAEGRLNLSNEMPSTL